MIMGISLMASGNKLETEPVYLEFCRYIELCALGLVIYDALITVWAYVLL
jgi:hypothetical protein